MLYKRLALGVFTLLLSCSLSAQIRTNTEILQRAATLQAAKERTDFQNLLKLSARNGWKMMMHTERGLRMLIGVDAFGYPLYYSTESTLQSAATIGTNQLWIGGSLGLSLSGSSTNMKDKMAIWDGGRVRPTHVELTGRISQVDNPATTEDHSTHVAGILMSAGVNPLARGMSYGLQELKAYDFNNDVSEMFGASSNLLISNHSYSVVAGWNFNSTENRWEFSGLDGANEDYKFGYYDNTTQVWDSIAYNAPYYLIVKAAGNNRNQNGPAVGATYWRYNSSGQLYNAGPRPAGISNNDSYDIIPTYGTAKNILTVGAVQPLSSSYSQSSDVVMSPFSSWGPTDDGRIKPDVVTDGMFVLSTIATSDYSYGSMSGTSMASPAAAGSAFLLQEYYSQLHGTNTFMRAATLKGIIIHTADEAGPSPGPDYQFGWGLVDMAKAGAVIKSNNNVAVGHYIYENVLANGATDTKTIVASGNGPLVATICWTDPKGAIENTINDPTSRLVNDLDIRIKQGSNTYLPWKLDPANRSAAATKGDNTLDNVEKVEISNPVAGQTYTIQVTHKGTLQRGSQAYSLIVSDYGVTATAPVAIDFAATGLAAPDLSVCPSGSQLVSVKIKNTGTTAYKNIPVTTVIKSGSSTVATLTGTFPDTIAAGKEVVYTYATGFNAIAGTTYTFTTTVNFAGDLNTANNQQIATIAVTAGSSAPTNTSADVCNNIATLKATAPNGGQVFWYNGAAATTPIIAGTDTTTTTIPSNFIYYAGVNDYNPAAGAIDKTISTAGNYIAGTTYINFTTYTPLTIQSARLYIGHRGTITFNVGIPIDATHYTPVSSVTLPVYQTETISSDPGATFLLNLPVPAAGNYRLYVICADGATIFYNSNLSGTTYPYTVPNIFSLTGNSGDDGNGRNYQNFYLGLYNLGLQLYGCSSARVQVQATNCGQATDVEVWSNPGNGQFKLHIPQTTDGSVQVSLINTVGQRVYTNHYATTSGSFTQPINVNYLQAGVYMLVVEYNGKRYTKKVVIRN